jgi:hypothetical protein
MRLKRERSLWPEFGWIPGNLCEFSNGYFAPTFLSSSLTWPASQSRLWGHVPLARICATFPRFTETVASPCGAFFSFSGGVRISCASLWSRIFNIRVLISETGFELACEEAIRVSDSVKLRPVRWCQFIVWMPSPRGIGRPHAPASDLQRQSHLRIDLRRLGAQRRERHTDKANSFPQRKLSGE